jgi:membrane protein
MASLGLVAALCSSCRWRQRRTVRLGQVFQKLFGGEILLAVLHRVLAIFTLLFTAIDKVLPDMALPRPDLVLGAFVTAVLFTVGKSFIGIYLGRAAPSSPNGGSPIS